MPGVSSRRTLIATVLAVIGASKLHSGSASRQNPPIDSGNVEALSGIKLAWESPWQVSRDELAGPDIHSIILDAGLARFALVSSRTSAIDHAWNTPPTHRDMQINTADEYDFAVLASFDDETGSHALTIDEKSDVVRSYNFWETDSGFLIEMNLYAPLVDFVAIWNEARQTIRLDDVPVFEGYDEDSILAPVVAITDAPPIDPTPIANNGERAYLGDVWSIQDDLDTSSEAAHETARGGYDPFGDEILNALQPYVDVWPGALAEAENLSPPDPPFRSLHDTLMGCVATFAAAAEMFGMLDQFEGLGRSSAWSEFTRTWDEADDQLRTLGDLLATFELP